MPAERTLTPAPSMDGAPRPKWWSPVLTVRLMQVALWLVVVTGPVVAVLALGEVGGLRDRIAAIEATSQSAPDDTTDAEGLALVAVADHLTGAGWTVTDTAIVTVTDTAPGVFAVTVAAHVTPPEDATPTGDDVTDEPVRVASRRLFLTVAMAQTDGGWVTGGWPAVVTGPEVPVAADSTRRDRLESTPGLEDTVVRFLAAYLTGDGDVERYTAPDTSLQAVSPAPFTAVEVIEAGTVRDPDGTLHVSATVEATDPSGQPTTVGYTLSVVERDGRFEVARLLPPLPASSPMSTGNPEGGSS